MAERTLGVERASEHPQGNEEGNAAGLRLPRQRPRHPGRHDPGLAGRRRPSGTKAAKRRGPGPKGPDKSVPDVAAYDVCRQVVNFRGGRLVVSVQNRFFKPKITVELAADAKIGLDLGDLSVVKPGEQISATGYYVNPGTCDVVTNLEVALTNPLGPPGSRHRTRPAAHGSDTARRPGGKTKPADEAAAGKNAASASGKAPAKEPAEVELPGPDMPAEKANPSANEPAAKPEPAAQDNVMPPAEETKPEPKKPVETPESKKPPVKDDEKDVFEK